MEKTKKRITIPQDKTTVNINQNWQLKYWTIELNVPVDILKKLVAKAGNSIVQIRHALKEHRLYTGQ